MHPYATDPIERHRVIPVLVALSVLTAWGFSGLLDRLRFEVPWWLDAPSVIGFFGIYTAIFNRFLWKMLRRVGIVRVPDLNGVWEGTLNSSHEEYKDNHPITIEIEQTWDQMAVTFRTRHSSSKSAAAALFAEGAKGAALTYTYLNEPKVVAKDTMHPHRGTTYLTLRVEDGEETLAGEYYTGRGRQSVGTLVLKRRRSSEKWPLRKSTLSR